MAVVDVARKTVVLKIVYYGCAMGGKTTNLITLHRLTDPDGSHGLVSIATKDDRTLFFDLLPMDLGKVGGLSVSAKVYTVPGQVHYELTRRQVVAGSDAVVLVVDSAPEMRQANTWALENLRFNLRENGLKPDEIPIILQWNKRDLPNVRPVEEMQAELNTKGLPSQAAVASAGPGVVETFALALKAALKRAYQKAGRQTVSQEALEQRIDQALAPALSRAPSLEQWLSDAGRPPEKKTTEVADHAFERRASAEVYKGAWAERGIDRKILDHETLLAEAVQSSMALAEKIDGLNGIQGGYQRLGLQMDAIATLTTALADPGAQPLPPGFLSGLLKTTARTRGSILLFRPGEKTMEEREVVPPTPDPLNASVAPSLGSAAYRLCQPLKVRVVEDLASEVFFDTSPPGADGLQAACIAPIACDGLAFGGLIVYGCVDEPPVGQQETRYWCTVATLLGLSLHWRALRKKLKQVEPVRVTAAAVIPR